MEPSPFVTHKNCTLSTPNNLKLTIRSQCTYSRTNIPFSVISFGTTPPTLTPPTPSFRTYVLFLQSFKFVFYPFFIPWATNHQTNSCWCFPVHFVLLDISLLTSLILPSALPGTEMLAWHLLKPQDKLIKSYGSTWPCWPGKPCHNAASLYLWSTLNYDLETSEMGKVVGLANSSSIYWLMSYYSENL